MNEISGLNNPQKVDINKATPHLVTQIMYVGMSLFFFIYFFFLPSESVGHF